MPYEVHKMVFYVGEMPRCPGTGWGETKRGEDLPFPPA